VQDMEVDTIDLHGCGEVILLRGHRRQVCSRIDLYTGP
jgi:hypothetical protein